DSVIFPHATNTFQFLWIIVSQIFQSSLNLENLQGRAADDSTSRVNLLKNMSFIRRIQSLYDIWVTCH
ncbi:hypothetical protein PENTCL1PPCAC_7458, partial [Pristionchus entomophagus]